MPTVIYIQPDGRQQPTEVRNGASVMIGAIGGNVSGIDAECGGALDCATCHVYVDRAWVDRLPPISDEEDAMLEGVVAERRPESRLSCQLKVDASLDGLVIHVPEQQS